jgi:hypothetical protein
MLSDVEVTVADLPGLVLARSNGNQIEIDANAAGHGWFVDPTAGDDSEFDASGIALDGSGAEGDVDLLTVLMHELGHVLGFEHDSLPIMEHSLSTSERWQITSDSSTESTVLIAESLATPNKSTVNTEVAVSISAGAGNVNASTGETLMTGVEPVESELATSTEFPVADHRLTVLRVDGSIAEASPVDDTREDRRIAITDDVDSDARAITQRFLDIGVHHELQNIPWFHVLEFGRSPFRLP